MSSVVLMYFIYKLFYYIETLKFFFDILVDVEDSEERRDNEEKETEENTTAEDTEEDEGESVEEEMDIDLQEVTQQQQQPTEENEETLAKKMEIEKQKVLVKYLKVNIDSWLQE